MKNVQMTSEITVDTIPDLTDNVKQLEEKLGKTGRILVRGTAIEPVIRVTVEGQDHAEIDAMADELCELICTADVLHIMRFRILRSLYRG